MCMARIITEQVPSVAMSLVWSSFAPVEKGSSARESGILETVAKDLRVRGAESVESCVADLTEFAKHQTIISRAVAQWDGLDAAISGTGSMLPSVGRARCCHNCTGLARPPW